VEVSRGNADAAKAGIIEDGLAFFHKHRQDVHCPLCEQKLPASADDLIARLDLRSAALRDLKEAFNARKSALEKLEQGITQIIQTLELDLTHIGLLTPQQIALLKSAKEDAEALRLALENSQTLTVPASLNGITDVRTECLENIKATKAGLVAPDASKLEAAISYLERVIASA
jgi:DNA repair exonuclease SbcCD ATPase subunit